MATLVIVLEEEEIWLVPTLCGGPAWKNGHFEQRGLFVVRFFNATKYGKARGQGCLSCWWCTFLIIRKVFSHVS